MIGKRVLVTGGAGFIGSHLCEYLLNKGANVFCLDNLSSGSKGNISHLMKNVSFKFLKCDVTSPINLEVDEIYNLASPASPLHYQFDPIRTTKTNILGAITVLDLANKTNAKILQASTSEIYGEPKMHPQKESYWGNVNPIGYRSCYNEAKRCAETLFFDYYRMKKVRIKIVRIFNTYGSRMCCDDGRVVSNFIYQALNNKDITIYGDGSQTRSFCYIKDLIKGVYLMMQTNESITGPVNLGNPKEYTIKELAEKVVLLTNSKSKFIFKDLPNDDPLRRKPNIKYAEKSLCWKPIVQLDEGLKKTINYFKKLI